MTGFAAPLSLRFVVAFMGGVAAAGAGYASDGDAQKGGELFAKCKSCHAIGEGAKNKVGPALTGIVGRAAGSFPGYAYSTSMQAVAQGGLIWQAETLEGWLTHPTKFLRARLGDTKAKARMSFRLKDAQDRLDVIAYLTTFSAPQTKADQVGADLCVQNGADHRHFFAAEIRGEIGADIRADIRAGTKADVRVTGWLDPGDTLCAPDSLGQSGTVSVFETEDTLEGCSRLVASGTETLIRYADFDRCAWGAHQD